MPRRQTEARGYQTDEGFVVLEGSRGDGTARDSLQRGWRARREELLADGSIRHHEYGIEYVRDVDPPDEPPEGAPTHAPDAEVL